ncbi:MAG: zinc transporter ZupT, partial [Eubacteriales bacterium]
MDNIVLAFGMTVIAGLCTGIGSLIAFVSKSTNKVFLSISLGFSAGVMLYVSMIEIFVKAQESLVLELGEKQGAIATVVAFFGGMLVIAIIDKLIPSAENPHEMPHIEDLQT